MVFLLASVALYPSECTNRSLKKHMERKNISRHAQCVHKDPGAEQSVGDLPSVFPWELSWAILGPAPWWDFKIASC